MADINREEGRDMKKEKGRREGTPAIRTKLTDFLVIKLHQLSICSLIRNWCALLITHGWLHTVIYFDNLPKQISQSEFCGCQHPQKFTKWGLYCKHSFPLSPVNFSPMPAMQATPAIIVLVWTRGIHNVYNLCSFELLQCTVYVICCDKHSIVNVLLWTFLCFVKFTSNPGGD